MGKTMKKILCTLLVVVMCLTSIPLDDLIVKATDSIEANDNYIVLILDASGSMSDEATDAQRTSAKEFCDAITKLRKNNYIAIVELNTSATTRQKFTNDVTLLNDAINKISNTGGTDINEALELADSLLSNIDNDSCSKSIVLCSDGLPESGLTTTTGHYNKNDYSGYGYANYVYNTALNLHEMYSVYTVGFFHSLSGDKFVFARRFMSDIQNAGYYEATNFNELIDGFTEIAGDVSNAKTYEDYIASLIKNRKNTIVGTEVIVAPVGSDVWTGSDLEIVLNGCTDALKTLLGIDFKFTSEKYFQLLFLRLMAEQSINYSNSMKMGFETTSAISECMGNIMSTYKGVTDKTKLNELPLEAKLDIQDYFKVDFSKYEASDICSDIATILGGAATVADAISATKYYKAITECFYDSTIFDCWRNSAQVISYEKAGMEANLNYEYSTDLGYANAYLGGDQSSIMAEALLNLQEIIDSGNYEQESYEYWKDTLKNYSVGALSGLLEDLTFNFVSSTLGGVLGVSLTALSTLKSITDVCDFIDSILWAKEINTEKNIAAMKCIDKMFKNAFKASISSNNSTSIIYAYESLVSLFDYAVKYQKENVDTSYFDYQVSDGLILDTLYFWFSFGISDLFDAKKIRDLKSEFNKCIEACEKQVNEEKEWFNAYSKAYKSLGNEYSIIFDQNVLATTGTAHFTIETIKGGDVPQNKFPSLINNYDYVRSGYTFVGWYTSPNGNTRYDFTKPITQSVHLYAKWLKTMNYNYRGNNRIGITSILQNNVKTRSVVASSADNYYTIPMVIDKYIVASIQSNAIPSSIAAVFIPITVVDIASNAIPKTTTIYCESGSYAHRFAKKNGYEYNVIDDTVGEVGDIIQFGSYPQNKVTDNATISALNSLAPSWNNWISYGYYSGTGDYGSMVQGDWMKYTDINYNGNKYRGVKFTQYRPYHTYYLSNHRNSDQFDNGYYDNTIYWFKFEPINWRILDPSTGLVLCETIIDAQPYSNTIYQNNGANWRYANFNDSLHLNYASDYETSSIRKWLNNEFYNTAFSNNEKNEIYTTTINNNCVGTLIKGEGYEAFDSNSTSDKIFLISYDEALNSAYGFNPDSTADDTAKVAVGSDYAKSQGLFVYSDSSSTKYGISYWLLRTPSYSSPYNCYIYIDGDPSTVCDTYDARAGVRPALRFKKSLYDFSIKNKYTVTYDANGSLVLPSSEIVEEGTTMTLNKPINKHYSISYNDGNKTLFMQSSELECKGWSTSSSASIVTYSCKSNYTPTSNVTLYAVWDKTVSAKISNEIPEKEGYEFKGWATNSSATSVSYKPGDTIRLSSSTILYAVWKNHTHNYASTITPATCTENGTITYICNCGDSYSEVITSNGHIFDAHDENCQTCGFDRTDNCSCNCHKGGIAGFFFKIILFFQRIFKTNKTCACGIAHY